MNSRTKGSVAEREVALSLQIWWRVAEPSCKFVRTPLSGGWGGPDIRAGFKASGDLMTTATRFPFCVEVKRRENWSLDRLVKNGKSPVWAWWEQTCKAAGEQMAIPMLWLRKNREPWRIMLPAATMDRLIDEQEFSTRFVLARHLTPPKSPHEAVTLLTAIPLMAPRFAEVLATPYGT